MDVRTARIAAVCDRLRKAVTEAHGAIVGMLAAFALALVVITPATAAEIKLALTDVEQKALVELLDLAVKGGGIGAAQNAGFFYNKIIALQAEAAKPAPPVDDEPPLEQK